MLHHARALNTRTVPANTRMVVEQEVLIPKKRGIILKMLLAWLFTGILSMFAPIMTVIHDNSVNNVAEFFQLLAANPDFLFAVVMLAVYVFLEGVWSTKKAVDVINALTILSIVISLFGGGFYVAMKYGWLLGNTVARIRLNIGFLTFETICAILSLIIIGYNKATTSRLERD